MARVRRDELDRELTLLIDHAASLSIGWPGIAARLGVTRQAARQRHHRRQPGRQAQNREHAA